ncbi:hypothetical protein AQUSIP_11440 [Aquicella siphonis]|uniref:ABC-type transport auxiliary lipoprotein component domain-containing protein n=1 Tax=Aquicella siphonis TaxID=254247 RepID=A0A5E4PHC2_9COXI|nr:ABC-type transport auxiliary lipoprotein family protein [Aquicella siphonis]VVC75847.1 hypothetical protein AQUSIP_11440 [Aquicella siphonis]
MIFYSIQFMRYGILILAFVSLSACSFLSPVKPNLPDRYLINRLPAHVPVKKNRQAVILVSMPETHAIYNTTQMAYSIKPYQIAYFSQNEWAEPPVQMLQPLLVQTLQNTHSFRSVVTPPYSGHFDYVLNTQLLELKQDFTRRTPVLVMTVNAQLYKVSSQQIIAARQFNAEVMIPYGTPYGGVFAANYAASYILGQIANFCLANIH